jgi:hypothetical protein
MKLHSILLTGDPPSRGPAPVSDMIAQNIATFRSFHPQAAHHLYRDEEMRQLVSDRFGPLVTQAYDGLIPLSYKSDLGRFCLLYSEGGIYSDVANFFFGAAADPQPPAKLAVYRHLNNIAPWAIATGLIAAPPGLSVFANCIERICEHVRTRYYGHSALCPTGPVLFGSEITKLSQPGDVHSGSTKVLNQDHGYPMIAFLDHKGRFVAIRRKFSLGIGSLGVRSGKTYDELYRAREIYAGSDLSRKQFHPEDYLAQRWIKAGELTAPGRLEIRGARSWLITGPRLPLKPGKYSVVMKLGPARGAVQAPGLRYAVTMREGRQFIVPPSLLTLSTEEGLGDYQIDIDLPDGCNDLEVLIGMPHEDAISFGGIVVTETASGAMQGTCAGSA